MLQGNLALFRVQEKLDDNFMDFCIIILYEL